MIVSILLWRKLNNDIFYKVEELRKESKQYLCNLNKAKDNVLEFIICNRDTYFGKLIFGFVFYQSHFAKFINIMSKVINILNKEDAISGNIFLMN